jgi:hypothetical protein
MNHLDVTLAARAHSSGRALRSASFRHRRLTARPLAVVLWQLGAEPFSAAALCWGDRRDRPATAVAGEPRNRDLAFAALLPFARWFNPLFEAHAADRETVTRGENTFTRARTAPQVLVANAGTAKLLGNLGRRLAYLPTTGNRPADPALVRLGRHLCFLWDHCAVAGQQLLVSLTDLLNAHWVTPQSPLERQSLAALDTWIEPPPGEHGFAAAARTEAHTVGPVPDGDDDEALHPLVERFNELRASRTDATTVVPLLGPIADHYRPLLARTWDLLWCCRDREAAFVEAPSVARRWDEDRDAYTRHIDWLARSGLRRTRQTSRQAALTLRRLEDAGNRLEAEEACDDPLRMIPYLLLGRAVRGRILAVDATHKELISTRRMARPLVTLLSSDPCLLPAGKELYWTGRADGTEFVVQTVAPHSGGGSCVTLKLMTSRFEGCLPDVGDEACFSVLSTGAGFLTILPQTDPWPHQAASPPVAASPIEEDEKGSGV